MKVCVVIADITRTGGTERATVNLANLLCESQETIILSLGKKGAPFFELNRKVEMIFLGLEDIPISFSNKITWYQQLYKKLKLILKQHSPHIIIGEGHNISTLLPLVKSRNSFTLASEHIDYNSIPNWSKALMRFFYPKLDGLIVLSEIAKSKLLKLNSNIFVIPNSIPFEIEKISNLKHTKIIMVGRISFEKGYERLIPIAKKLKVEFPEWEINIFGNGPLKEEIKELYNNEKLDNIKINNPVQDIKTKYLDSSIHLITSYNEAMPMVILEAQYCGLPVIGFRCEGTESLIKDGKNGFVVDSADEFYEKLKLLILNRQKREEIGLLGKKATEIYDSSYIKIQWENILNNLQ